MTDDAAAQRPRRKRGTGSVRQTKWGRFYGTWPRSIDPQQRNIWTSYDKPNGFDGTYETYEEAEKALDAMLLLVETGQRPVDHLRPQEPAEPERVVTVHDAVREYLDSAPESGPGSLSRSTIDSIESALRRHIDNPEYGCGDWDIKTFTQADFYAWTETLREKIVLTGNHTGDGSAIRSRVISYIKVALTRQVKLGRIPVNPAMGLQLGDRRKSSQQEDADEEIAIPAMSAQHRLIVSIPDEGDRLFALALMWGGARLGELAGAADDALLLDESSIQLEKQWKRKKSDKTRKPEWIQERLKSGRRRKMRLPSQLIAAIDDWYRHRRVEPLAPRKPVLFPFVAASGDVRAGVGVWTASAWAKSIVNPLRDDAGMGEFTEKQWRAGVASLWDDAGFRQFDIQRQLGHRPGSRITELHYTKALEDERDELRERIRQDVMLTPQQRLDALWDAWVAANGDPLAGAQNIPVKERRANTDATRRAKARAALAARTAGTRPSKSGVRPSNSDAAKPAGKKAQDGASGTRRAAKKATKPTS